MLESNEKTRRQMPINLTSNGKTISYYTALKQNKFYGFITAETIQEAREKANKHGLKIYEKGKAIIKR